jgi:hypothetical protein
LTSGPTLISIIPNDGSLLLPNETLHTAPTQLTFRFLLSAGETLNPNTLDGIELTRSGGSGVFGPGDGNVPITPGYIGIDPSQPNQVDMRFSSPLPDDLYQISVIGGSQGEANILTDNAKTPLPFDGGQDYTQYFRLQLSPQVLSVVPQPVTRSDTGALVANTNEVDVYFNEPLQTLPGDPAHLNAQQFELIYTNNTASTNDDTVYTPASVDYDALNNEARLLFNNPLDSLGGRDTTGAFRLHVGNTDVPVPPPTSSTTYPGDANGTFTGADNIGTLGTQTQVFNGGITSQTDISGLSFPGSIDDPGHRDIPLGEENHVGGTTAGSASFETYSFPDIYGSDPVTGQPLHNQITPEEEQTVREIFQLWSYYTGISFQEVPTGGEDNVVVGDPRVLDPAIPPTAVGGIAGGGLAIINGNIDWSNTSLYGGGFMGVAMHEIGHTLGLPHDDDGPPDTIMNGGAEGQQAGGGTQGLFPGIADITNLQFTYEPTSNQIDLYKFDVDSAGTINAQTVAQRTGSTLNSLLTLYEEFNDLALPAGVSGVVNGDTFKIANLDGTGQPVTFEFTTQSVTAGSTLGDGNAAVPFGGANSQQDVANAIIAAIENLGLNVTATYSTGTVQIAGPVSVTPGLNASSKAPETTVSLSQQQQILSRNDDYYGTDSFASLSVQPGIYYVAVTASGNDQFNPDVANSGWGGQTFGNYSLQVGFKPAAETPLTDPGLSLYVPANPVTGPGSIPDGYSFTFTDTNTTTGQPATETIKFYNGSTAPSPAPAGQVSIQLQSGDTQESVTQKVITALQTAIAAGNFDPANYILSDIGNGRIELGGVSSTKVMVDPTGKGALAGTPLVLWGDTQTDPLTGNSGAGGTGAYNFWFNVGNTIYVDKTAPTAGANGTAAHPYSTIQAALKDASVAAAAASGTELNLRVEGNANATLAIAQAQSGSNKIIAGDTFQVSAGTFKAKFEFVTSGVDGLQLPDGNFAVWLGTGTATSIAQNIETALNAASVTLASGYQATLASADGGDVTVSDGGSDKNYYYITLYQGQSPLTVNFLTTPFNPLLTGVAQPTLYNNGPYLIGTNQFGATLPDDSPGNSLLQLPKNVVLMADAGAVFKIRQANIEVGSSAAGIDDSQSALQALGIPGEQVTFTSYNDDSIGTAENHPGVTVKPGDWGGLVFNNDSDLSTLGMFLSTVEEAKLNYGGGQVSVNGVPQFYDPIYLSTARPAIANNVIINSNASAISANPNSFENSTFGTDLAISVVGLPADGDLFMLSEAGVAPGASSEVTFEFVKNVSVNQQDAYGNQVVAIPLAGLTTPAQVAAAVKAAVNQALYASSVDEADVLGDVVTLPTHLTFTNLPNAVTSAVGTSLSGAADSYSVDYQRFGPDIHGNTLSLPLGYTMTAVGGSTLTSGTTFIVDNHGFELLSSGAAKAGYTAIPFTTTTTASQIATLMAGAINAANLGVTASAAGSRVTVAGAFNFQAQSPLTLAQNVAQDTINGLLVRINTNQGSSLDTLDVAAVFASTDIPYVLQENLVIHDDLGYATNGNIVTQRVAGSLVIDPGVIVKLGGSRLEAGFGSNVTAEGTAAQPIIFTSINDATYGSGGTFDTADTHGTVTAQPGDWGGFYFWPTSSGSFDNVLLTYGGGETAIEGGFDSFDAIEIHQAKVRITNSTLEFNAATGGGYRNGRMGSDASTIFVLGAQPVIVNNVIENNAGAAISVDVDSLNETIVPDWGRSTGPLDAFTQYNNNYGPLVALNKLASNGINGMVVRGGTLEGAGVWDDTDIVHVLEGTVSLPNFASGDGTLRLESSATQSLVVKMLPGAGFHATGTPLDISDRIGGSLQILGTPQHPVVITSIKDDSVGAGLTPSETADDDTNNDGGASQPAPGDWNSIEFDQWSNDTNLAMVNQASAGLTPASAQLLGTLAPNEQSGDDNSRLGFQVNGYLNTPQEVDTYSFQGTAGSQVWINVTNTASSLDGVLELVDANGNVLARSDNSLAEQNDATAAANPLMAGPLLKGLLPNNLAQPLQDGTFGTDGTNFWSTNPYDPGFRVVLPGTPGTLSNYYVRFYAKGPSGPPATNTASLPAPVQTAPVAATSGGTLSGTYYYEVTAMTGSGETTGSNPEQVSVTGPSGSVTLNWNEVAGATGYKIYRTTEPFGSLANQYDELVVVVAGGSTTYTDTGTNLTYLPNSASTVTTSNGVAGGQYQLQIRLQEEVQIPGSSVQYADIRYATNGIDVEGLPAHSPLVTNSSTSSVDHSSFGSAQDLGDLLTSDTSSLSVGGNLGQPATVDWYKFELTYADIQAIGGFSSGAKTWSTMFDVGYADGLTRPNTTMDVYDSNGNLVYEGTNSDIADQQPQPNEGQDASNLSHESFGQLDPYIGPVQMETGSPATPGMFTYYVAIHSDATLPAALDGIFNANSQNYLVRLEPVDSINRVVEDHVGTEGGETAESVQNLAPLWGATPTSAQGITATTGTVAQLNAYAAPFNLSDVVLYVNTPGSGGHLETVNPFTGTMETDQGQITSEGQGFNTMAMRNDGELYGLTLGTTDGNSGNYVQINTGTAAGTVEGNTGISTYYIKGTSVTGANLGVQFNAMAFVQPNQAPGTSSTNVDNSRELFAIGSYEAGLPGAQPFLNGLYKLNPDTGAVLLGAPNGNQQGAINEDFSTAGPPTNPLPVLITGVAAGETITGMAFVNNTMFAVGNLGNLYTVAIPGAPTTTTKATLIGNVGRLSLPFSGLTAGPPDVENGKYADMLFSTANGNLFAFDTTGAQQSIFSADGGASFVNNVPLGVSGPVSLAFSTLDYNLWHVTQNRDTDTGHGINVAPDQSRNTLSANKPPQNAGDGFTSAWKTRPTRTPFPASPARQTTSPTRRSRKGGRARRAAARTPPTTTCQAVPTACSPPTASASPITPPATSRPCISTTT